MEPLSPILNHTPGHGLSLPWRETDAPVTNSQTLSADTTQPNNPVISPGSRFERLHQMVSVLHSFYRTQPLKSVSQTNNTANCRNRFLPSPMPRAIRGFLNHRSEEIGFQRRRKGMTMTCSQPSYPLATPNSNLLILFVPHRNERLFFTTIALEQAQVFSPTWWVSIPITSQDGSKSGTLMLTCKGK